MAMGTYAAMLRSTGDALTPGLISIFTCVLDIIFNFFLINPTREITVFGQNLTVWGLGWGVPGAALGTALANAVGGTLALGVLLLRMVRCASASPARGTLPAPACITCGR